MSNYNEVLQGIWKKYTDAGMPMPASKNEVAMWAYEQGLWQPKPTDFIAKFADELARAAREEYRTDAKGRRYRARHPAKMLRNGESLYLWDDIDIADREHMQRAFSQRRKQIVGDCCQLKTDVDHYNDNRPEEEPIQMVMDFTDDVAEREAMAHMGDDEGEEVAA